MFSLPGGPEWIIIGIIGLLLFGKRLPEVGRSLGKSVIEFKKGLQGIEDDISRASEQPSQPTLSQPALSQPATSAALPSGESSPD